AVAMFMYRGFKGELVAGPGYRTDHLMMMRFGPGMIRYTDDQSRQFFQQVADHAKEVPGIKTVAMTTAIPMSNDSIDFVTVAPEGFAFPQGKDETGVLASKIDEHYFDTMGISLAQGRNFTRADDAGAPRVAIVNQHFAQHYWPDANPLGKRFRLKDADNAWVEVVGVAKLPKSWFPAKPPAVFSSLPYRQQKMGSMTLVAQSTGDAAVLAGPLREVARGLEANMPVFNVRTMESLYHTRAIG